MAKSVMPTQFLPAERATAEELKRQMDLIQASTVLPELLDAMACFALILNKQRQAVFVNKAFQSFVREHEPQPRPHLGQRTGESLGCAHSESTPGGCGTTEFCRVCGAAQAIAAAVAGQASVQECRLQARVSGEDLDLLVRSTPFRVGEEGFVIFAAVDISHEKRRRALERIFLHDVTNTAGGIGDITSVVTRMNRMSPAPRMAPTKITFIASNRQ